MYVEISKEGLLVYRWSPRQETYIPEAPPNPLAVLRTRCELAPDVSVESLLLLISKQDKLREFCCDYSCVGGETFHSLLKELDKPADPSPDVRYMQIAWASELRNNEMNLFPTFHGVTNDGKFFGFINTPLAKTRHAPVILNKEVRLLDDEEDDEEDAWFASRSFTLLDVLSPIFWEIGFFGKDYVSEYTRRVQHER